MRRFWRRILGTESYPVLCRQWSPLSWLCRCKFCQRLFSTDFSEATLIQWIICEILDNFDSAIPEFHSFTVTFASIFEYLFHVWLVICVLFNCFFLFIKIFDRRMLIAAYKCITDLFQHKIIFIWPGLWCKPHHRALFFNYNLWDTWIK